MFQHRQVIFQAFVNRYFRGFHHIAFIAFKIIVFFFSQYLFYYSRQIFWTHFAVWSFSYYFVSIFHSVLRYSIFHYVFVLVFFRSTIFYGDTNKLFVQILNWTVKKIEKRQTLNSQRNWIRYHNFILASPK